MGVTTASRDRMRSAAQGGRILAEKGKKPTPHKPGKPGPKAGLGGRIPPMGTHVVGPLPLYLQLQRIGGGLTPQEMSNILREADLGRMYRLCDLGNEMRQKDNHLQGILETHETELSGLEWSVTPPNKPSALETKATDFIRDVLTSIAPADPELSDLTDLFAHMARGFFFPYAVSETMLEKVDGQIIATGFDNLSPRRFVFELSQGRLQQWDQTGGGNKPYPGLDYQALWPGKFITFQPSVNGDVKPREGLIRPLMWAALFRNWTLRDWLSLAELSWKPWRTGKYSKNASDEDIANLFNILQNMVANGIAVYPEGAEILVEWPKNLGPQGSPHFQLFDVMGREMSKAVLGNSTTTELSQHGSQNASQTGREMQTEKRNARANKIAGGVTRHLITPLIRMNYGADVRVPGFRFATEDEVDGLKFAQSVQTAGTAGLKRIPARHVRDKLGIPEAIDGEEVLEPPAPPSPAVPGDDAEGGKKPPPTKPKKPAGAGKGV